MVRHKVKFKKKIETKSILNYDALMFQDNYVLLINDQFSVFSISKLYLFFLTITTNIDDERAQTRQLRLVQFGPGPMVFRTLLLGLPHVLLFNKK